MSIQSDLKERANRISTRGDYGRGVAVSGDTITDLLRHHRQSIPDDILQRLRATQDSSRDPPTHVILKPSVFVRLADSLPDTDEPKPATNESAVDVP
jgi:hypothetical protein